MGQLDHDVCNSVEYTVLMNNEEIGPIMPGRGLRQGDPLSPYMYILCEEGLSSMLKDADLRGLIHGIKICRSAPILSHLLFADDSFLFFQANNNEADAIKDILQFYENASGQCINFQKSEVSFSANVSSQLCSNLSSRLGVREALGSGMYLGLPFLAGRNKRATFNFIKEHVQFNFFSIHMNIKIYYNNIDIVLITLIYCTLFS